MNAEFLEPLTDKTFENKTSHELSLVLFWAPWCGPCLMLKPVLEDMAKEYIGRVKFFSVNTDQNDFITRAE